MFHRFLDGPPGPYLVLRLERSMGALPACPLEEPFAILLEPFVLLSYAPVNLL